MVRGASLPCLTVTDSPDNYLLSHVLGYGENEDRDCGRIATIFMGMMGQDFYTWDIYFFVAAHRSSINFTPLY